MEIIKVTPNMLFVLETNGTMLPAQQDEIHKQWKSLFSVNQLLICTKGSIKILELPDENITE